MSGFTIPGLGFAKPNETLPPAPADVLVAASSLGSADAVREEEQNNEKKDVPSDKDASTETAAPPTTGEQQRTTEKEQEKPSASTAQADPDAMNVDNPPSPPSLTSALEAALGPPEPMVTEEQTDAPPQATLPTTSETPAPAQNGEGEQREWETDSSPIVSSSESSSSDSSSDDDDDDDDEDNEGYELLGVDETVRMLMEAASDDENDGSGGAGGRGGSGSQLRTKNELPPEVIPKPDVTITPETKIEPLGEVQQIVENILVIKAYTPGEYQVLDTGSVLCTEDRAVFGVVYETIGKVLQPMYTVMFPTAEAIAEAGLKAGTKVFYPVDHASFVFTEPLRNLKGSDASNIHDEEVGDDEMEFSDDEKEAEYKRQMKQKKREGKAAARGGGAGRGGKGREPHPLRNEVKPDRPSAGLNYDDDEEDDGPYKPLQRPASFGQGPSIQQNFTQEPEPQPRFGAYRGRADFRGRGGHRGRDRGRGGRGRGGRGDSRDGHSLAPGRPGGHSWSPQPQQAHQQQQQQPYQQQTASYPPTAAFNFSVPVPQPGQGGFAAAPQPPPNWTAPGPQSGGPGGQQSGGQGAYFNPALLAALIQQMQQQKQAGAGEGQAQWQPPQPPPPTQ